ncbi:MAG TPA: response regulator transcription factor [Anaerolineales bacterium]|nr:response regulator transcription factor [Anaerolineales bacterium]
MDETTTSPPIRVLIADDHKLVCMGLRMVLERAGIKVVGEASTGRQAVEQARQLEPQVILLDIIMPDMDGLQALAALRASQPRTSVIMSTAYARPDFLARAIAAGAAGYITKDDDPASIPRVVRAVVEGEAIVNRDILTLALRELSGPTKTAAGGPPSERPALTPQQIRVLSLIAEGMDNAAIADTLYVSKNTVKTHVRDIFARLGVNDRTQAAIWALRNGMVPDRSYPPVVHPAG